ncbi:hypothetical protein CCACVL1_01903 [Corchorus capsularis]|uniref:Uncharacterized protein n=1 Tax=Corchorus capsularis TaxID=210143 RepID=A0A1R3KEC9_COCAP|nr:hypothetical protein CCACVL1_01903 [Corchorus capsularis]
MAVDPKSTTEPPFPTTRSDLRQGSVIDLTVADKDDLYSSLNLFRVDDLYLLIGFASLNERSMGNETMLPLASLELLETP